MKQDHKLKTYIDECEIQKWKEVATRMKLGIKVCRDRARALGIK
jgi:hypothetical protein